MQVKSLQFNTNQRGWNRFNPSSSNPVELNSTFNTSQTKAAPNAIQYNWIQSSLHFNSSKCKSSQVDPIRFNSIQRKSCQSVSIRFNNIQYDWIQVNSGPNKRNSRQTELKSSQFNPIQDNTLQLNAAKFITIQSHSFKLNHHNLIQRHAIQRIQC